MHIIFSLRMHTSRYRKGQNAAIPMDVVTNEHAIGFYRHYGFRDIRIDPGVASDQILMEREL